MAEFSFSKEIFIREKKQFKYLYANSKCLNTYSVRIYYASAYYLNTGKLGFVATKKLGNAVKRNYCKRLLKEICRINQYKLNRTFDILFVAKRSILNKPYSEVATDVIRLLQKNKLFCE